MTRKSPPSYAAVREWAKTLPTEFLECRAFGVHDWGTATKEYQRGYGYYFLTWNCQCGAIKHAEMDATGDYMGDPWPIYPPGYLSPIGRITGSARSAVRLALLDRFEIVPAKTERAPRWKGNYARVTKSRRRKA